MFVMTPLSEIDLVLASTSRYRAELLKRLTPQFRQIAPGVNEAPLPAETPDTLAVRLAQTKSSAVAMRCPGALIIGSDQVADLDGQPLGKSGNRKIACDQLTACAGRDVVFHTAVCVIDTRQSPQSSHVAIDRTHVVFRQLDANEIARYVDREQPFDCAGSFKAEGLGIALFERIDSEDPSALIGLPLIALCKLLRQIGVSVL